MKGSRPIQGELTFNNNLDKTSETEATVSAMVDGLNDHDIEGMQRFFNDTFRWMGNAGCGYKKGLTEFQENWQKPFQEAFSDKVCIDEARITQGQWCAAFGRQEAVHTGTFMGIEPTNRRVEIRYMEFWKVEDGKITHTWVMVDFPYVMPQLLIDPFSVDG